MTFTTKHEADTALATMETANVTDEQSEFLYYNEAVKINSTIFDHTNAGGTNYSLRLTGMPNHQYGLAKSLSVMPGDTIRATVYAKYLESDTTLWNPGGFTTFMNAVRWGSPGSGVLVDGGLTGSTGGVTPPNGYVVGKGTGNEDGAPKAYLNYLVFDRNYALKDGGYIPVTSAAREYGQDGVHEELFKELAITEAGYVYLYLSNDNAALGGNVIEVFFDDFTVEHVKSPVIQQDDYYPFGLTFNSYQRENATANQYLYNGKEKQDELDLGWIDYGARMFMPEIGKWVVIDGKSELYFATTPYAYALNQPTNAIDPDGNLVIFINGMHSGTKGAAYWRAYSGEKEVYAFDRAVMNHVNDHKAIYRDGALGGASNTSRSKRDGNLHPEGRSNQGYKQGTEDAEMIIENLARDKNGNITESIKIITHSMGGAYGKGYAKAILDYARKHNIVGVTIAFEADFAPFQSSSQKAVKDENMGPTLQFSHDKDKVAGNKPIDGAEQVDTDDDKDQGHSILSFVNQISKLPAGKYKVVNGQIVPVKEKEKKKKMKIIK